MTALFKPFVIGRTGSPVAFRACARRPIPLGGRPLRIEGTCVVLDLDFMRRLTAADVAAVRKKVAWLTRRDGFEPEVLAELTARVVAELAEDVAAGKVSHVRTYAGDLAANARADILGELVAQRKHEQYIESFDSDRRDGGGADRASPAHARDHNALDEDDLIERIDMHRRTAEHGQPRALTAFEREEFWDKFRAEVLRHTGGGAAAQDARAELLALDSCHPALADVLDEDDDPRAWAAIACERAGATIRKNAYKDRKKNEAATLARTPREPSPV